MPKVKLSWTHEILTDSFNTVTPLFLSLTRSSKQFFDVASSPQEAKCCLNNSSVKLHSFYVTQFLQWQLMIGALYSPFNNAGTAYVKDRGLGSLVSLKNAPLRNCMIGWYLDWAIRPAIVGYSTFAWHCVKSDAQKEQDVASGNFVGSLAVFHFTIACRICSRVFSGEDVLSYCLAGPLGLKADTRQSAPKLQHVQLRFCEPYQAMRDDRSE